MPGPFGLNKFCTPAQQLAKMRGIGRFGQDFIGFGLDKQHRDRHIGKARIGRGNAKGRGYGNNARNPVIACGNNRAAITIMQLINQVITGRMLAKLLRA